MKTRQPTPAASHQIVQVEDSDGSRSFFATIEEALDSHRAFMMQSAIFTQREVCEESAEWSFIKTGNSEPLTPTALKATDRCELASNIDPGDETSICRSHTE